VLTRKAAAESPAMTADVAAAQSTTHVCVATEAIPITESVPTAVCGGERNRVSGQSPGESRSRTQNDHGLT
jgi:hypothetical protein